MPKFTNAENQINDPLPRGDYIFTVTEFTQKLSSGAKTGGSEMYKLTLDFDGRKVFENLINHPDTNWRIDTFLKSAGVILQTDAQFEWTADAAKAAGCTHVEPVGLMGWAQVGLRAPENKYNEVKLFYTDKEKLPRSTTVKPPVADQDAPF